MKDCADIIADRAGAGQSSSDPRLSGAFEPETESVEEFVERIERMPNLPPYARALCMALRYLSARATGDENDEAAMMIARETAVAAPVIRRMRNE